MQGIDPKWVFYLGVIVTIQTAIGQGAVSLTNVFPELWVPYIKGWSTFLGFIGTTVMTALSGYSSAAKGPLVSSPSAQGFKPLIIILVVLAGWLTWSPARAADLTPPPAPIVKPVPFLSAATPCTAQSCSGFYAGFDVTGIGTNLNVIGNGIGGSLNAGGTELGGHIGYRTFNGTIYLGGEVGCGYNVAGNVGGFGASDRLRCLELVKAGGALSALFGGNQVFQFPDALQSSFMSFYGILGGTQRLGVTGLAGGVGAEFVITPKLTMTLEYLNITYEGAGPAASPTAAVPSENLFRLGLNYNF